jgi:hypothetical protein
LPVDPASSLKGELRNLTFQSLLIYTFQLLSFLQVEFDRTRGMIMPGGGKVVVLINTWMPTVDDILHRGILPRHTKVGEWCKLSSSTLQISVVKSC